MILSFSLSSCSKKVDSPQLADIQTGLSIGLTAYYPFNGNVKDSSGNANHGTIVNSIIFGLDHNSKFASAVVLGTGRVTTNTTMFNFQYGDSFSLSFWVLDNGTPNGGRLLSTENSEGNFRISSFGNGAYAYNYGSGPYLFDTLQMNVWTHISLVYSNRNISLYKNGVLKTTSVLTTIESLHYGSPFTIGSKASPSYDKWNGRLDDLRIYNRALSKQEAEYLYAYL